MLSFPPFRLDLDQERLWKGQAELVLRRKPFAILRYLAGHPNKLVTHEELLEAVWRGTVVSDSAVRSHLHELRQVLGDGVIETVIGRGYRFVAAIGQDTTTETTRPLPADGLVVGREVELEALRAAFERARAGQRQVCFVSGAPGIGKTTLVRQFLSTLDQAQVAVAVGACFEQHGAPEPYHAVIEAIAGLARSTRGPQVVATLVRYAPTFLLQVPNLLAEEQVVEVARRTQGSGESRQLRELSEALEAFAARDPLVLVLEDLQWSDVATIDLLSLLGQRRETARLLVIASTRQAEAQSPDHPLNRVLRTLVARSGALAISVAAIDAAAVGAFIDRRFPGHELPEALLDLVTKITGGTPLFMVALLDELTRRGMIAERDGRWALTVSVEEVRSHRPASVKQLIDLQLDRLSATEQRVLEAAGIVGAEFSIHLVAAALELTAEEVDELCDGLVRRSLFLRREADGRYGVSHALVQEVCVERTSPLRRQRWHRRIAEAIGRDLREGDSPHLLAKHYDAAGDPGRAVPAYAAAARLAGQRYAASDAIALCARALDLVPQLPDGIERDGLELQILGTMCQQVSSNSFKATFAGRDPLTVHARAIQLARSLGDLSGVYGAITRLCSYNMIVARYRESAAWCVELERIEASCQVEPVQLHKGIFARAYIAFFEGELGTAIPLLQRLVPGEGANAASRGDLVGEVVALGHLACARWVVGEAERAIQDAAATIGLAEGSNVAVLRALGHVVRARLRYLRRDPLAVIEAELPALLQSAAVDLGLMTEAKAFAMWAKVQRGPVALAELQPLLDDLRERMNAVSTCSTLVGLVLVDALRHCGHEAAARDLTDEVIAFARSRHERVYLPELLRQRSELRQPSDPEGATSDLHEALNLAKAMGALSLERRAALSLAKAAEPSGSS